MKAFDPKEAMLEYGGKPQRLIFYNVAFNEKELKKLQEVKEFCKKKGVKVPDTDAEILKCLHGEKFSVEGAYKASVARINYMNESLPRMVNPVSFELLNRGFLYICGRDRNYRPILVNNGWIARTLPELPSVEDIISTCMIVHYYIDKYMLVPGKVENICQINDNNNKGFVSMDIGRFKDIAKPLQMLFKGKVRSMIGLNQPATL